MKIHLDLDAFFISAERIKDPSLRGIPAAVGGRGDPFIFDSKSAHKIDTVHESSGAFVPSIFYNADASFRDYFVEGRKIRGIIITASYEARSYGIKTGMTVREALELCPHLRIVAPNHLYYHQLSHRLHLFLKRRIPSVEQFSIDEFFGDLSGWVEREELEAFLRTLQKEIEERFGLPISIGAAKSKWTAKLATSFAKPKGIKIVDDVEPFIRHIPIQEFPGIGRGYLRRLRALGITTLGETRQIRHIFYSWKKPGITLYRRIWGIDNEPIAKSSPRKSIGISRTIDPLSDRGELRRRIMILARHLAGSITKLRLQPTYYALGVRYENGYKTRAHLRSHRLFSEKLLQRIALELFSRCDDGYTPVVRLGISCSGFYASKLYDLFHIDEDRRLSRLLECSHKVRSKFGMDSLRWGVEMLEAAKPPGENIS